MGAPLVLPICSYVEVETINGVHVEGLRGARPPRVEAMAILGELTEGGHRYVIKLANPANGQGSASLFKEIRILRGLRHPNIISVATAGRLSVRERALSSLRVPYYVMPRFDADLFMYTEGWERNLRFSEVQLLLTAVLSGLRFLHRKRVMHGDLTGINVLIRGPSRKREVVIADFGRAMKLTGRRGSERKIVDRPLQEHDTLDPYWSTEFDLFGLAALVYNLCCNGSFRVWAAGRHTRDLPWRSTIPPRARDALASSVFAGASEISNDRAIVRRRLGRLLMYGE